MTCAEDLSLRYLKLLLLSILAFSTIGCSEANSYRNTQHTGTAMGPPVSDNEQVVVGADLVKPACDKLSYRALQLPNKLRVLLIHDPDTDKAAAALDVSGLCIT